MIIKIFTYLCRNEKRNKKRADIVSTLFVSLYNGLPVCAMRERVNRYTVNFVVMLTTSATYGKMFLDRKGCGRR